MMITTRHHKQGELVLVNILVLYPKNVQFLTTDFVRKMTLGIRLEIADPNSGNHVLVVTQWKQNMSREANMADYLNKKVQKIMLNIGINNEYYMKN